MRQRLPRAGYAVYVSGAESRVRRARQRRRAPVDRGWQSTFAGLSTRPVDLNSFPLASYNSTKASQRLKINKNTVKINLMKPLTAGFFVILVSQNSQ
ncbi:MAG: hypothetical protein IJF84_02780 [Thermoguttaceae bacterium]|nr:hypothetical protein [Thermoguttaceae bacterium]